MQPDCPKATSEGFIKMTAQIKSPMLYQPLYWLAGKVRQLLLLLSITLIKLYRYCISPYLGDRCRFYPSCSAYAEEALIQHGLLRGSLYSIKRLLRCHPWHPGGIDPVPTSSHSLCAHPNTTVSAK